LGEIKNRKNRRKKERKKENGEKRSLYK
jgi:hypothetical protein